MPSLHIPYTLSLVANTGRTPTGQIKRGFVSEFDCQLDVEYTDHEDFEVVSVTIEQCSFCDEFTVDAESDPELWKLMQRAVDYDWLSINERIQEMIASDMACADDDYHYEQARDRRMGL